MAQDLSGAENIILTHLSDRNSDEERFMDNIKALTGKPVCAAKVGMTLRLTKKTFMFMVLWRYFVFLWP